MNAFAVLSDPVRRRILVELADGERSAGEIVEVVGAEFGISQSAVSQHLAVLRESGFATVRRDGPRRIYAVEPEPIRELDEWVERFRHLWDVRLDALHLEILRGRRGRTGGGAS